MHIIKIRISRGILSVISYSLVRTYRRRNQLNNFTDVPSGLYSIRINFAAIPLISRVFVCLSPPSCPLSRASKILIRYIAAARRRLICPNRFASLASSPFFPRTFFAPAFPAARTLEMTNFMPCAFRVRDADGSRNRMKGEAGLTGFPVSFARNEENVGGIVIEKSLIKQMRRVIALFLSRAAAR